MNPSRGIILSTLLCALASTAVAQIPQVPAGQGQDRVTRLQKRLERLQNEIVQIEKLREDGGLVTRLRDRLTHRDQELRSVEVKRAIPTGVGQTYGEQNAEANPESSIGLMSDQLKSRYGDDVIAVVESVPATRAEYDALLSYLQAQNPDAPAERLEKDAMVALLTRKVARARGGQNVAKAEETAREVLAKLNEGADFAQMAREFSEGPTRSTGGDLNFFGRGQMDLNFEFAAFSLAEGETSGLVESPFGFHIIKVTDVADDGRIRASHILRLFQSDASAARVAATDIRAGRAKVLFRDTEWRSKYGF